MLSATLPFPHSHVLQHSSAMTSKALPLLHSTGGVLTIDENAIAELRSLQDSAVVISCVGNVGCGKSFFLNRIIEKEVFDVGSMKSATKGVWVHLTVI